MGPYFQIPGLKAGGDVRPCRFVTYSAAADFTVLESNADDRPFGISQKGTQDAPGLTGASALAAASGDPLTVYGPGSVQVHLEIGSGGVTRGQPLMPDADGKGITATTGKYFGAIALESAAAGEFCKVLVQPGLLA